MNPLKCSYLAFLVLLCLGFSFGHRILLDTQKNDDTDQQKNQTRDNKDMAQTQGLGVGFGSGSDGGAGIGVGMGGASNQKCHGEQCQQPCPIEGPCQGQGEVTIPGIQIPGFEIPPIQIPIPIPPFPYIPITCPPRTCRPDPCPPQTCTGGICPPYNCQNCVQETKLNSTATELGNKTTEVRNHEVAADEKEAKQERVRH